MFEIVAGELRVKLGAVSAMRQVRSRRDTCAVAAGPGRASSLHAEPHISNLAPLVRRAPEGPVGLAAVPVGGGPSARRPRRELRSARRLEARPGPAAAHGHRSQARDPPDPPAPSAPAVVGVLHYTTPSGGVSSACRRLVSCNSPDWRRRGRDLRRCGAQIADHFGEKR